MISYDSYDSNVNLNMILMENCQPRACQMLLPLPDNVLVSVPPISWSGKERGGKSKRGSVVERRVVS